MNVQQRFSDRCPENTGINWFVKEAELVQVFSSYFHRHWLSESEFFSDGRRESRLHFPIERVNLGRHVAIPPFRKQWFHDTDLLITVA